MNVRIAVGAILFILLAGALAGCSRDGDVTIVNDCSTPFDGYVKSQSISLAPGDSWSSNVYIGKKGFFVGPDDIDIPFGGSTFTKRPFDGTITITADETTTIRVSSDAGAIFFTNSYSQPVRSLSMRRCSESEYGENLLGPGVELAQRKTFLIRLNEGCWDLLIQYGTAGLSDAVSNDTILVGEVDTILWTPEP
jgi:hypothetical protein